MSRWIENKLPIILIPITVGIALLFIPLLGDFHIESAILVSLAGCFWGGVKATQTSDQNDFYRALQLCGYLLLTGLPLLVNALVTGCFSIHGLLFWLLFPLPSVCFGFAVGRLARQFNIANPRLFTVSILTVIGVGVLLVELLTYPQVYFFNHVWGGWPGPIYDEVVTINWATVFFRLLTLLWAALLWYIPNVRRGLVEKWLVGILAVAIMLGYLNLPELGITSPRSYLQKELGKFHGTEHFNLYYDGRSYSSYDINLLAAEHEFYYHQIAEALELGPRDSTDKIESYLYRHPWQKKRLVGAKFTSYVPVWLDQDQLHIAKQQLGSSLNHELVHVLAKQFGNWYNASWSIGLIEGVAVAIAGSHSGESTIDQIVVSEKPYPTAKQLQDAFSFLGFYGGRSGVNYTTSGSFVRFLLQKYPADNLKEAYRTANIPEAYNSDWQKLTGEWHSVLDTVKVDTVDREVARYIFSIPSLFEQKCPHVVSNLALAHDQYRFFWAEGDSLRALEFLDQALVEADSAGPLKTEWSYRNLVSGKAEKVRQAATLQDSRVDLQLLYADAFALNQNWEKAGRHLAKGRQLLEEAPDSLLVPALKTREDRKQWEIYRTLTYKDGLPDSSTFEKALYRTKVRSLRKAMEQQEWEAVKGYAEQLAANSLDVRYFNDYQSLIHHLVYVGEVKLAEKHIQKLSALPLRNQYQERLEQERAWIQFLKRR